MVGVKSGVLNSNVQFSANLGERDTVDRSTLEVEGTAICQRRNHAVGAITKNLITHLRSSLWFEGNQVTLNNTGLQGG